MTAMPSNIYMLSSRMACICSTPFSTRPPRTSLQVYHQRLEDTIEEDLINTRVPLAYQTVLYGLKKASDTYIVLSHRILQLDSDLTLHSIEIMCYKNRKKPLNE